MSKSSKVFLVDLDNTILLSNNSLMIFANVILMLYRFFPIFGWRSVRIIHAAINAMLNNHPNSGKTNYEILLSELQFKSGQPQDQWMPLLQRYYAKDFPRLRFLCRQDSSALRFLEEVRQQGGRLFLATNPIWPESVVRTRLEWAGVNPEIFDGITHSQNWSSCKPSIEYYQQILSNWNVEGSDCLMIGDSVEKDAVAGQLGIEVKIIEASRRAEFWQTLSKEYFENKRAVWQKQNKGILI